MALLHQDPNSPHWDKDGNPRIGAKHTERTPGGQEDDDGIEVTFYKDPDYGPRIKMTFQGVWFEGDSVDLPFEDACQLYITLGNLLSGMAATVHDDKQPHRYEVGQHVTLINGASAVILSQWHEDDGTPGYGVQTYFGFTTGIHEAHIDKPRTHEQQAN